MDPSGPELYVAACQLGFALELLRTFMTTDSAEFKTKFMVGKENIQFNHLGSFIFFNPFYVNY